MQIQQTSPSFAIRTHVVESMTGVMTVQGSRRPSWSWSASTPRRRPRNTFASRPRPSRLARGQAALRRRVVEMARPRRNRLCGGAAQRSGWRPRCPVPVCTGGACVRNNHVYARTAGPRTKHTERARRSARHCCLCAAGAAGAAAAAAARCRSTLLSCCRAASAAGVCAFPTSSGPLRPVPVVPSPHKRPRNPLSTRQLSLPLHARRPFSLSGDRVSHTHTYIHI